MNRDDIVNIGAAGAVLTPWWLPTVEQASYWSAKIAPILGVLWLMLQISLKLLEAYRKWKFTRELSTRLKESNQFGGSPPGFGESS